MLGLRGLQSWESSREQELPWVLHPCDLHPDKGLACRWGEMSRMEVPPAACRFETPPTGTNCAHLLLCWHLCWARDEYQKWAGFWCFEGGWRRKPCLFKLYAKYILRNSGLEKAQAGIKIAGRNINNLRYADDTLMAESEELKSLLMKVKKESEKVGLKLYI